MKPDAAILEKYLHDHIPITRSMGVTVSKIGPALLELNAPIAPNINHRETVFGGSASAVAILSAWGLVHFRLLNENIQSRLVIQKNTINYLKPIESDFSALCRIDNENSWRRFINTLLRKKISRINMKSLLSCLDETVANFEGDFVAILR